MRTYERAIGSQLKLNKSLALAVGGWPVPITLLGIDLFQQVKISGSTFGSTVDATVQESWTSVTNAVRTQARTAYARNLCLAHRVQYVQTYVLTKLWYLAQVLSPPTRHIQQLTTTCTLFIWRGAYFRVPKATLQWPKNQGGWTLPDIALKCRALLLGRMRTLAAQKTFATAAFLRTWNLTDTMENPPYVGRIPSNLVHVRQYALDMAYIPPTCTNETLRKMRSRIYGVLRVRHSFAEKSDVIRVVRKHPDANWKRLWITLHTA